MSFSELDRIRHKVEQGESLTDTEFAHLDRAAREEEGPALKLTLAHALLNKGEERAALSLLEVLARDLPRDVPVLLGYARALLGLERYAEAEAPLRTALTLNPGDPEVLKALAVVALRRGEVRRARQWVEEALRVDPIDDEARLLKAELDSPELPAPPVVNPPASQADFLKALMEELSRRQVPHVHRGKDLLLQVQGGGVARVGVESLYASHVMPGRGLAAAVEAAARELASLTLGVPRRKGELLSRVLPVLRPAAFVESAAGSAHREGPAGLLVFYVLEDPELVRYLPRWAVEQGPVTLEELDAAAWENLGRLAVAPQPVVVEGGSVARASQRTGLWIMASGDGHDAARLLTAPQRALLAKELGAGPHRVSLSRRELVLVCPENEAAAVTMLESLVPAPDGIHGRFRLDAAGRLSPVT